MSLPLVIGASGFIGRHVKLRLWETHPEVMQWSPSYGIDHLAGSVKKADVVYHCAGATRAATPTEWERDLAITRCLIKHLKPTAKVVYTSSIMAGANSHYGATKQQTEIELAAWGKRNPEGSVKAPRLPNVYGKWARPHHNSIVATWCYELAQGKEMTPVTRDEAKRFMHIDEVCDVLISGKEPYDDLGTEWNPSEIQWWLTEGLDIKDFMDNPWAATMWSYQKPRVTKDNDFNDHRGVFSEFSLGAGQVNYLTIRPDQARGNHWHHNRIETFVLYGRGLRLMAQHVLDPSLKLDFGADDTYPMRVTVPPGWVHKLINTSNRTHLVPLWASDVFDPKNPDTIKAEI